MTFLFASVIALRVASPSNTYRFLGLRHAAKPGTPRWEGSIGLPGGKIDLGETALGAAVRELWEETGVLRAPDALRFVGAFRSPDEDPVAFFVGAITAAEAAEATQRELAEGRPEVLELGCLLDPHASPYARWNAVAFAQAFALTG